MVDPDLESVSTVAVAEFARLMSFFFQAEAGIRVCLLSRGLDHGRGRAANRGCARRSAG